MEGDKVWYGTNQLWTWLDADGTWETARDEHGLVDNSFWWRQGDDWRTEPVLRVTGRRLNTPAPAVTSAAPASATRRSGRVHAGGAGAAGWGCWELSGHDHGRSLRLVVWVTSEQP